MVVRSGALSEKEVVVDTEALSAGIYFVRLEAQNNTRKSLMVSSSALFIFVCKNRLSVVLAEGRFFWVVS